MKLSRKILSVALAGVTMFTMATASSVTASAEWIETNGKTYYENEDGKKVTGWQTIDGEKYYFSSKGVMKTGWLTMKSGKKYYLKKDGTMVTGWLKKGGEKYYFNKKGVMATGFTKIGKKIYSFANDGKYIKQLKYTYVDIGDKKYSLDKNGNLCMNVMEGIKDSNGKVTYYYFGKNGYAITTTKTIDGITYEFDAKKGFLDAYIKVKTGEFDNKYLKLSDFSMRCDDVSNQTYYKTTFSGYITNTSNYTLKSFFIYVNFYDYEGNVIDDKQLLACDNLRPGEKYKFDDFTYVDEMPYRMEFTDYSVYRK